MEKRMNFKFLEHTADIKFIAYGKDLNNVFENTAEAFTHYVGGNKINKKAVKRKFTVSGKDNEEILYKFIDELIYLLDVDSFVPTKTKVRIQGGKLRAEVSGDIVKNGKHAKAATYAEIYVKKSKDGWEAQTVIDV